MMEDEMEVRKKEIPQGWKEKRLGDLVEIVSGVSPSLFKLNSTGLIPYLKVEDLNNCDKYQKESRLYSDEKRNIIPKGSIIFPKRGAAILNNKVRINTVSVQMDSNLMAIYPKKEDLLNEYLYYQITYQQLHKIADTSTIPQINNKHIIPYSFPLSPLPEQRAIAHVLGQMDRAIQLNDELVAAKELRKKWLMQNLLTGKMRLKGFEGEWKKVPIKEVAKEISIRNKEDKDLIVLSCTKYDGLVPSLEYFGRKIYSDDTSNYKIVPKNHFAYATNHIEEGSIGYQGEYDEALISPMYTIFKTKDSVDDQYFFMLLKSHKLVSEYGARMEGSIDRRGGLRWSGFSMIKVPLPSLPEQVAIAQVLGAADKELGLLRAKGDLLREQKQGMMQVLLTGEVRLPFGSAQGTFGSAQGTGR
ncbi:MAG: restriction endonuclease subunit S [Bacteroidia bacterium]|nr:restriction endonuclease subunit S [Bacteroidia bacterium]